MKAHEFFVGTTTHELTEQQKRVTRRPPPVLTYDPKQEPAEFAADPNVPAALQGLWFHAGQTFGIEFELTADDFDGDVSAEWEERANILLDVLRSELGNERVGPQPYPCYHDEDRDHSRWNVEYDGSCGWEVTSRILQGEDGFREVIDACKAIEKARVAAGLEINHQTGTHIHLGWIGKTLDRVKHAILLAHCFEPALATLIAPSRIVEFDEGTYDLNQPNWYCAPVSTVFDPDDLTDIESYDEIWERALSEEARFLTFNILPLENYHTVECRMHSGTTEARKILLWVSLWMQILHQAEQGEMPTSLPPARDVIVPDGDILKIANEKLYASSPRFRERLHDRRKEVKQVWSMQPELEDWTQYASDWET